ncbi:MAG: hypothetical protein Q4B03_07090 [Lachnospiraceae bacterium]|nr:hypothetical protein [Lachnospiraceae bacterium]
MDHEVEKEKAGAEKNGEIKFQVDICIGKLYNLSVIICEDRNAMEYVRTDSPSQAVME